MLEVGRYIFRFGGTDADWSTFYNASSAEEQALIWKFAAQTVDPNSGAFIVPFFPKVNLWNGNFPSKNVRLYLFY